MVVEALAHVFPLAVPARLRVSSGEPLRKI
jgi:hypothetical protein